MSKPQAQGLKGPHSQDLNPWVKADGLSPIQLQLVQQLFQVVTGSGDTGRNARAAFPDPGVGAWSGLQGLAESQKLPPGVAAGLVVVL